MSYTSRVARGVRPGRAVSNILVMFGVAVGSIATTTFTATAAVDTLPPNAPPGANQTVDGGYALPDWISDPPVASDEINVHNCVTYISQPGQVNDPVATPPIDPADFDDLYVRCAGLGDKNEGVDDNVIRLTSSGDSRWMGQYAVISARTDGPGQVIRLGYCALDSAGHPSPNQGTTIVDNATKALFGYSTNPELDYLLWKHGNTYSELGAAAVFAVNHLLQGDVDSGGTVVVSDLPNATDNPVVNDLAVALLAESAAHVGPWTITVDNNATVTGATVTVTGPAGPIRNESFNVTVAGASGAPATITTDSNGQATIGFTPTGGAVTVTVQGRGPSPYVLNFPPGGEPDAQALASAGPGVDVSGSDTANPGFIRVVKTVAGERADASYISPDGTLLELRDNNGVSLGQRTVSGGVANWGSFDAAVNPAPYSVYELDAAPGLQDPDPTVPVGTIAAAPSTDPNNPTESLVDNQTEFPRILIEKAVTGPIPAGSTLAGFQFTVTRDDGQEFGTHTTDALLGGTPEIVVTQGTYSICEVGRPDWSLAIQNPPTACQSIAVTHDDDAPPVVFTFTNVSNTVRAATRMATPYASPGDTVVDQVWVADTVAGREYRANVTWFRADPAIAATNVVCDTPGFSGSVTFTGQAGEVVADVPGTVPAGTGVNYWAAGQIVDVATGFVVATLPCGDPLERLAVPAIATISPAVVNPGEPIRDTYTVTGIPAGSTATIVAEFPLHNITSGCEPTSPVVGTLTETITTNGTSTTTTGVTTNAGVFVFRERLTINDTIVARPPGFSTNPPGVTGDTIPFTWSSNPVDCLPQETTWVPELVTQVREPILTGQPSIDDVTVSGLPVGGLAAGESVTVVGGLYWHPLGKALEERTCTAENRVSAITPITVTVNGTVSTAGITGYPVGVELSYQEHADVVRVRDINGVSTTETFSTAPHGCQIAAQTQRSQPSSGGGGSTPTTTVPRSSSGGGGNLPSTGSNTTGIVGTAAGMIGFGGFGLLIARRRRPSTMGVL